MAHSIDWTLETATKDDVLDSLDVTIDYSFKWGSLDSWTEPGDPPEAEIDEVWYGVPNPEAKHGFDYFTLSLTAAEEERVLDHIYQNPPEPDEPDYDWSY